MERWMCIQATQLLRKIRDSSNGKKDQIHKGNNKTEILGCEWAEPGEGKGYSTGAALENTSLFVFDDKRCRSGTKDNSRETKDRWKETG